MSTTMARIRAYELKQVEIVKIIKEQELEMALDAAANACPARLRRGSNHSPASDGQVQYQKCGGGRRAIKKAI